jgi:hypothetical protein
VAKAALSVIHSLTPEQEFRAYLDGLDDDKLACKAGRHNIPKLKPGRLPQNTDVRRQAGGVYAVTVECLDCGLPATLTTGKGGVFDPDEHWELDYSALPGYLAPKGTGRGRKADYKAELGQRVAADIREEGARTASREAARKRIEAARRAAMTPKQHRPHNAHATNPSARRATRAGERKMESEWQQRDGDVS